jgi:hypothetical protein
LIALIINAHHASAAFDRSGLRPDTDEKDQLASSGSTRRRAVKLADV